MTSEDLGGVRFSMLLSFYAKAHQKVIFHWRGEIILPEFIDLGKRRQERRERALIPSTVSLRDICRHSATSQIPRGGATPVGRGPKTIYLM